MAKVTKDKVKSILTSGLGFVDPDFRLEKAGGRWVGNVISADFKGKRDRAWQKLIWDALSAELGSDSVLLVGLLLAYTPDECNLDAEVKKAG